MRIHRTGDAGRDTRVIASPIDLNSFYKPADAPGPPTAPVQ